MHPYAKMSSYSTYCWFGYPSCTTSLVSFTPMVYKKVGNEANLNQWIKRFITTYQTLEQTTLTCFLVLCRSNQNSPFFHPLPPPPQKKKTPKIIKTYQNNKTTQNSKVPNWNFLHGLPSVDFGPSLYKGPWNRSIGADEKWGRLSNVITTVVFRFG